jgi:hypothetical protein
MNDDDIDQFYTVGINIYDMNIINKYSSGNYLLNFMFRCSFDVDGSEQINNLILNICGKNPIKLLDYYINILPSKVIFPNSHNLKKYVQFDCSNIKEKLRYNDFFIKSIESNNLCNAEYLYLNTPIDINKIFYKFIEDGNITFVKRIYDIYSKQNNDNETENVDKKIIYKNISIGNMKNNYELFYWFNNIFSQLNRKLEN